MTAFTPTAALRRGREALDNTISGQHASIHGKVAAHHKSTHGCVFLGENIRFIREVRLILAAVNQDQACESTRISVALVGGVRPSSTTAQAYYNDIVSKIGIYGN
jgi:hypothetical protein